MNHGTITAYYRYGCRCPHCTEVGLAYGREWRAENRDHINATRNETRARLRTIQPIAEPYEHADCLGDPDCRRPAARDGLCHRHYALEAVTA